MKKIMYSVAIGMVTSGCAQQVTLAPEQFLPARSPSDPTVEVKVQPHRSLTADYHERRTVDPEPWNASSGVPPRTGGKN